MRVVDANTYERNYIQSQVGSKVDYINIEVRNRLYEGFTLALLKYVSKFIYHRERNK